MPSIRDLITWGEGSEKMGTGQEHGAEPQVTNSNILGSTFGLHLSMVFLCTQTTYFLIPYRTEISSLIIFGQLKTEKHIHILRYGLRWKTGRLLSPHFPGYLVFHFYNNHKLRQPCRSQTLGSEGQHLTIGFIIIIVFWFLKYHYLWAMFSKVN